MLIIRRILANIIDVVIFFAVMILGLIFILPILPEGVFGASILIISIIAITTILQWPFMVVNQSIGKAFFGLIIVSTNENRPITPSVIIQRELLTKIFPFYLLCLPLLIGNEGHHDKMSQTQVLVKGRE
ncbi:MAG: RDD family protein [Defluviitaleaceae bacterium]|nr:RDD family protein [Defluviitaleaceae bacterium]